MSSINLIEEVCPSDCCKVSLTPFQPINSSVLKSFQHQQGKRFRNFLPRWYSTYPWLNLCITRHKAFCIYCQYCTKKNLLCFSKKGEDAFVSTGFNNWKKAHEKFLKHAQSDLHKEAILKIQLIKQKSVDAVMNSQIVVQQRNHQHMLIKQISSLKYLLRQGLAIRGHEDIDGNLLQLLKLRSKDCNELSYWIKEQKYFSPQILNE